MRYMFFALVTAFAFAASTPVAAQAACTGNAIFSAESCAGDTISREEMELFNAVNRFREANGLARVKLSLSLSRLGNRRMLDMAQNMKMLTHSWSNCRYDINDQTTWPCLTSSPTRLRCGYAGDGYETLFRTSKPRAEPSEAIEAWKKSTLHNSIILNKGIFADLPWEELGVAIDGPYAALWFGFRPAAERSSPNGVEKRSGMGISFDRAVAGLAGSLKIERVSTVGDLSIWHGETADRRLKIEVRGNASEIESVEVAVSTTTPGNVNAETNSILVNLLKNLLPELSSPEAWLAESMKLLKQTPKGWRRKMSPTRVAEIRGEGPDGFRMSIRPLVQPKSVEF